MNLYEYTDYRMYLADYYHNQKIERSCFSYQYFATRAGFKNKGFLFNIIRGKKNISKSSIFRISQAIGHSENEAAYFENLVFFNQAKRLEEQNHYFEKMGAIRRTGTKTDAMHHVRKDQFEFYAHWYHAAIRALVDMHPVSNNYALLAKMVHPPITTKQASDSVALLERIGLLQRGEDGLLHVANKTLKAGPEIKSLALKNLRIETIGLSMKALLELPKEVRNMPSLVVGISGDGYRKIGEELDAFQKRVLDIAESDVASDRVYQFDFNFFPLSKTTIRGAQHP